MSTIRINTANMKIAPDDIVLQVANNKRYSDYNNEVLRDIILEVISVYKNALSVNDNIKIKMIDDEELFDETYDYMLNKIGEMFSTADIAYLVDDVLSYIEDVFFDEGLIEYTNEFSCCLSAS